MGILFIPLFAIVIFIIVLCSVFFLKRKSEGKMASKKSYLAGIGLTVLTLIFFFLYRMENHGSGIVKIVEEVFFLYIITVIFPGVLGMIGIYIPTKYEKLNIIGFGFCISTFISAILSIPYCLFFI